MDSNYIYTATVTESIVSKYNQTNINDTVWDYDPGPDSI